MVSCKTLRKVYSLESRLQRGEARHAYAKLHRSIHKVSIQKRISKARIEPLASFEWKDPPWHSPPLSPLPPAVQEIGGGRRKPKRSAEDVTEHSINLIPEAEARGRSEEEDE